MNAESVVGGGKRLLSANSVNEHFPIGGSNLTDYYYTETPNSAGLSFWPGIVKTINLRMPRLFILDNVVHAAKTDALSNR